MMQSPRAMLLLPSLNMYEIVTLPASLNIFSPSTITLVLVWMWFGSGIYLTLCVTLLHHHTMTRPRGTLHRGGRHGSIHEAEYPLKAKAVNNGYDSLVSPLVRALIKE